MRITSILACLLLPFISAFAQQNRIRLITGVDHFLNTYATSEYLTAHNHLMMWRTNFDLAYEHETFGGTTIRARAGLSKQSLPNRSLGHNNYLIPTAVHSGGYCLEPGMDFLWAASLLEDKLHLGGGFGFLIPILFAEKYYNSAADNVKGYSFRGGGVGLRFMLTADYKIAERIHVGLEMRHEFTFLLLFAKMIGQEDPYGPNPYPSYITYDVARARNVQWPLLRLGFDL